MNFKVSSIPGIKWLFSWTQFFSWTGYKQVKLFLKRIDETDHGIFGQMTADSGNFSCVTLERHDIDIPAGSYKITLYNSPEHGLTPLLQNVPNRSMIEIHEGNWEFNSKGCILVGSCRDALDHTMIDNSLVTKKALVALLQGCDDITITIS